MIQKTIIAEEQMNKKSNSMGWLIAVQVPSGKRYAMKNILDPLKAMRYMFLLKRRENADIDQDCMMQLRFAHDINKNQKAEE